MAEETVDIGAIGSTAGHAVADPVPRVNVDTGDVQEQVRQIAESLHGYKAVQASDLVAGAWTVLTGGVLAMALPHGRFWAIDDAWMFAALSQLEGMSHADFLAAVAAAGRSDGKDEKYKVYDGVAHIPVAGTMTKRPSCMGQLFGSGSSTVAVRQALREADRDPGVKSKLLLIDSPGGEVSGSFDLAGDVLKGAKPTDTFFEDTGASAAMLVGSGGRIVTANPNAALGSVGIYTRIADTTEAFKQQGIRVHVVKAGRLKAIGERGQPVTEEHVKATQSMVDEMHGLFLRHLVRARPSITRQQLAGVADAGVYIGRQAVGAGLIDDVGDIDAAHAAAVRANNDNRRKSMSVTDTALAGWLAGAPSAEHAPAAGDASPAAGDGAQAAVPEAPHEQSELLRALAEAGIADSGQLRRLVAAAQIGWKAQADARERAKKLAVAVFGVDTPSGQAAVTAAQAFIEAAPHELVEATITQYEAQLRLSGAAADEGRPMARRLTAPSGVAGSVAVSADQREADDTVGDYVSRAYPARKDTNGGASNGRG